MSNALILGGALAPQKSTALIAIIGREAGIDTDKKRRRWPGRRPLRRRKGRNTCTNWICICLQNEGLLQRGIAPLC